MIKVYKIMNGMEQINKKLILAISHNTGSRDSKWDYKAAGLKQIEGSSFSQNV